MTTTLSTHGSDAAHAMTDELRDVYAAAYNEPPYNFGPDDVAEFVARLGRQQGQPGFTLVTARVDEQLAGFSYGYVFGAGRWWRGALDKPPAKIKNATKFAVIELVVHPNYRRRGYAQQLLDTLLKDRTEEYAILLSRPGTTAHGMYERWGWQTLGTTRSYEHWDADDVMVLPLRTSRPAERTA